MSQRHVVVPTVEIELGGETYKAVLNWNARAFFEEEMGVSLTQIDLTKVGFRELLALVHAALREEQPELTRKDVGKLIGSHNEAYVIERLNKMFVDHGPDEADRPLAVRETETETVAETSSAG